jgi:hypothetical protein
MGYEASLGRINIVDEISNVHKVQCAICTKVKGKEKLFMPKLNNLFKHARRHEAKVSNLKVTIVSFYFNLKSQYA